MPNSGLPWPRLVAALFALATAALGATVSIEAQPIVLLAGLAAMLAAGAGAGFGQWTQPGPPACSQLAAGTNVIALIQPGAGPLLVPVQSACGMRRIEHVSSATHGPRWVRSGSDAQKYEPRAGVETWSWRRTPKPATVPADAVDPVRAAPPPTPEAVAEIEAGTEHDAIAS